MVSVLLVEDDPAIAELYSMKLRLDGFRVHHAADLMTADVIFERARPEIVCVDTRLPDGSGVDVAARFSEGGSIVVLLTNDQDSFERPARGVALALLKSRTDPSQLTQALRRLIPAGRR